MTVEPPNVLVAGATGYLGNFLVQHLRQSNVAVTALIGPNTKIHKRLHLASLEARLLQADARCTNDLAGCCDGVHTVISCLAADVHQAQGSIWQVDRDANKRLFDEALRAGISHFVLVATAEGREARVTSELSRAKEEAVDYITYRCQQHGLHCSIIRPTAYFKDLTDWPWVAVRDSGSITIIGSGKTKINPIHGADLADYITIQVVLPLLSGTTRNLPAEHAVRPHALPQETPQEATKMHGTAAGGVEVVSPLVSHHIIGGPQVLTLLDLISMAAEEQGKDAGSVRIRKIPLWVPRGAAALLRLAGKVVGWERGRVLADGLEFAVYSCSHDSIGSTWGSCTVKQHYRDKAREDAAPGHKDGG